MAISARAFIPLSSRQRCLRVLRYQKRQRLETIAVLDEMFLGAAV
jgi:hypothetical protein